MLLDELRSAIEPHFWVHPMQGNHSIAATGEHYTTYCLGVESPHTPAIENFLVGALLCSFLCLRYGAVPSKPEGAFVTLDKVPPVDFYGDVRGAFLYWRTLPMLSYDKGITAIYTRALVSKIKSEGSQLLV